jgi:hypothetical protein
VALDWPSNSFDEDSRPLHRSLLSKLTAVYNNLPDQGKVKALVITNPHNPFGQCYPKAILQECLDFCQQRGIHYISDEIYALSQIDHGGKFVSALSLESTEPILHGRPPLQEAASAEFKLKSRKRTAAMDDFHLPTAKRSKGSSTPNGSAAALSKNGDNGHGAGLYVIWSTSKDLCSSGLRMVSRCLIAMKSRTISIPRHY